MMTLTKLNDVFENWATGDGVFTDLDSLSPPWKNTEDTTANTQLVKNLNMAYHGAHSGDKNISPIVHKFLASEDAGTRGKLANIIFTMFADKWTKLWDALEIEYNPLQNYNMSEIETTDDTTTRTGTETTTMTGTDTNAKTGTETLKMTGTDTDRKTGTETINMTGTDTNVKTGTETTTRTGTDNIAHTGNTENEVSAFNSSSYSDNTKDTINTADNETRNMTDTLTHNTTDTETRNMSDATTYNTTDTETRDMTDTTTHNTTDLETRNMTDTLTLNTSEVLDGDRHLTRSGNIGVTTSQQMLQSEIELRKWLYYQNVFNDIDTILTLSIY